MRTTLTSLKTVFDSVLMNRKKAAFAGSVLTIRLRPRLMAAMLCAWSVAAAGQPAIPALEGRVVDRAQVLSDAVEREITSSLAAHEEATSNQVAVLTVTDLQGYSVEEFALAVAREWALGTSRNNGVLFMLAVDDREMRIEVGYGLEGALPDAVASRILRNEVRPHLRRGDFDGGVRSGVAAILGAIDGTYVPAESPSETPPFWFGLPFLILPSFFAFMALVSAGCMRWFMFVFLIPFFWVAGFSMTGSELGGFAFVLVYAAVFILLQTHPKIRRMRTTMAEKGSVRWGPVVIGGGSGGFSGGGFSGGGFSGGGGSFGGGGASGGW